MKLNKRTGALAGLGALAVIGGTWAYFNTSAQITNPFATGSFATSLIEHFNPAEGQDWKPGVEVDKDVAAKNTGNSPVVVRVKMSESWTRVNGATSDEFVLIDSRFNAFTDATDESASQVDPEDGLTPNPIKDDSITLNEDGTLPDDVNFDAYDHSVVYKNLATTDWTKGTDGYWYYNSVLTAGQTTTKLLDSVTLAKDADMGKYGMSNETNYEWYSLLAEDANAWDALDESGKIKDDFDIDAKIKENNLTWNTGSNEEYLAAGASAKANGAYFFTKSTSSITSGYEGYAEANYDLTITTEFLQATQDAVAEEWATAPDEIKNMAGLE